MSIVEPIEEVLHRIKVRLRPSRLPGREGQYCARIASEAALGVKEVCAALKQRGGFTGSYEDAVTITRLVMQEVMYQLCDGYAVNLDYFSIHPAVGGFFNSLNEEADRERHPVRFRFRTRKPMRKLSQYIEIEVMQADTGGSITTFVDFESSSDNAAATPGGLFLLAGNRVKIRGSSPECGLYFVPINEPEARFKASGVFTSNTSHKITGRIPALPPGEYALEIKTQHTTGKIDLKEPRTVRSRFTLRVA